MIIQCQSCSRKFLVKDIDIPAKGRLVQCGYCSVSWHQMPALKQTKNVEKPITIKKTQETDDSPSVDSIKASNGKTYKFLGSQWVELLPSGKTGLFARKNISPELDEVTGRKERKIIRKKHQNRKTLKKSLVKNYQNRKTLSFKK